MPDPKEIALAEWRTAAKTRPIRGYMMERSQFVALIEHAPPEWVAANRSALAYTKHRMRDLWLQFGYVSAGVGTLVRMEAEALADADFLRHLAMSWMGDDMNGPGIAKSLDALRLSHNAGVLARGHAKAARELCREESGLKDKSEDTGQDLEGDLR